MTSAATATGLAAGNVRAGLLMAAAMACYTINDALIKTLDGRVPVEQVIAIRGGFTCFALSLLLLEAMRRGDIARAAIVPALRDRFVVLRGLCELCGSILFLLALTRLPFPMIAAILQAMPLVVTAGAALFLGERVGVRRWSAIAVGLVGVLIILRPGTDNFELPMLLMVGCVFVAAGRDLFTRQVPTRVPTLAVSLTTALVMTCAGLLAIGSSASIGVPTSFEPGAVLPDGRAIATLALASLFLVGASQTIVLAMRLGEVGAVVPFRYTGLLWATSIAWLAFDERPDGWTLVGSAIVVATGLYTFARERRLGRSAAVSDEREGVAAGR